MLQLTQWDLLPSHICYECLGALKNAFEFRQRCVRSDTTLRAILKQSFEHYVDSMKSAEESNDVQTDVMPVEEVKVENDNEGKEVSEGFDNLLPEHCFVDPTKLEENSDRDDCHSTSENESQVYPIFLLNVTDYCHFCLRFFSLSCHMCCCLCSKST